MQKPFSRFILSVALVGALVIALAACGDEPVTEVTIQPPAAQENTDNQENTGEFESTQSRQDLVNLSSAAIEQINATETDITVQFFNAAEPCSGARVTVFESAEVIEVVLETGLDPNAAAMSCIAGVFGYEITVPLDSPLGGRQVVAVPSVVESSDPTDPLADAVFPTDQYLGLSEQEAMELGGVEQRAVRVVRVDDEIYPVTMDFSPTRVNIEIEAGVVVVATAG